MPAEEAYVTAVRNCNPATTQAVADAVGVTRQGADYRLRKLHEKGIVTSTMVGNSLVWSLTENADGDHSSVDSNL
jgi:predicted transcriptional regulator